MSEATRGGGADVLDRDRRRDPRTRAPLRQVDRAAPRARRRRLGRVAPARARGGGRPARREGARAAALGAPQRRQQVGDAPSALPLAVRPLPGRGRGRRAAGTDGRLPAVQGAQGVDLPAGLPRRLLRDEVGGVPAAARDPGRGREAVQGGQPGEALAPAHQALADAVAWT